MATITGETVSNILQMVSDLRGESSTNTDAVRIRFVSLAERDYALRMFWRTHLLRDQTQSGDGTTSSFTIGSSTYPMRLKGLSEVFVGGTTEDKRYEVLDFFKYKNVYNNNNAARIAHEWYDAANDLWKMKINPTPANGDVITYSYFWEPPKRTSTSDVVVCPKIRIIVLLTLAYIYDTEDEIQKSQLERQEAEQLLEELEGIEEAPAVNQLYAMGPIESATRSRGIGSY